MSEPLNEENNSRLKHTIIIDFTGHNGPFHLLLYWKVRGRDSGNDFCQISVLGYPTLIRLRS